MHCTPPPCTVLQHDWERGAQAPRKHTCSLLVASHALCLPAAAAGLPAQTQPPGQARDCRAGETAWHTSSHSTTHGTTPLASNECLYAAGTPCLSAAHATRTHHSCEAPQLSTPTSATPPTAAATPSCTPAHVSTCTTLPALHTCIHSYPATAPPPSPAPAHTCSAPHTPVHSSCTHHCTLPCAGVRVRHGGKLRGGNGRIRQGPGQAGRP